MLSYLSKIFFYIFLNFLFLIPLVQSEDFEIKSLLDTIQKDLRTLERAVYSESFSKESSNKNSQTISSQETEDILTRHLLKLSEIEKQFQELTNKYEEVNFKLDKLSSRLSKVQADNQMRFQQLENSSKTEINDSSVSSLPKSENSDNKILPGSSQPQDLGSISYKDMTDKNDTQSIQSVESTKTIITEVFKSEEKILPEGNAL